jgi:hypothetical protein
MYLRVSKIAMPIKPPKARDNPRQKNTPIKKLRSPNSMFLLKAVVRFHGFFPGFEAANIPTLFVQGRFDNVPVKLPVTV